MPSVQFDTEFERKKIAEEACALQNEVQRSLLLAALFVFLSNLKGIRIFFEQYAKIAILPLFAIVEVFSAFLALIGLINADNKNLGKVSDFLLASLSATIVVTAVVLSFLGFPALIVAALFLAAIGATAIYQTLQCFYHAGRWLNTPTEDNHKRAFFHAKIIKYATGSVTGLVVVAGLVLTLMIPGVGATVLTVAGIATAVVVVMAIIRSVYQYFRPTLPLDIIDTNTSRSRDVEVEVESGRLLEASTAHTVKTGFDYYYQENRAQKLTGSPEDNRDFLLKETLKKMNSWLQEDPSWQQEAPLTLTKKHIDKVDYLAKAAALLLPPNRAEAEGNIERIDRLQSSESSNYVPSRASCYVSLEYDRTYTQKNDSYQYDVCRAATDFSVLHKNKGSKAHQSFWVAKSDTQDLGEAYMEFFRRNSMTAAR
jgi:hypothetical protein